MLFLQFNSVLIIIDLVLVLVLVLGLEGQVLVNITDVLSPQTGAQCVVIVSGRFLQTICSMHAHEACRHRRTGKSAITLDSAGDQPRSANDAVAKATHLPGVNADDDCIIFCA